MKNPLMKNRENEPVENKSPENVQPENEMADTGHLRYLLTAYLFENISEAGKREVEGHLDACADCRAELEDLRTTLGLVKEAIAPGPDGGETYSFEARRLERLLAGSKKKSVWRRMEVRAAVAAAAVLFLVIGILMPTVFKMGRGYEGRSAPNGTLRPSRYEASRKSGIESLSEAMPTGSPSVQGRPMVVAGSDEGGTFHRGDSDARSSAQAEVASETAEGLAQRSNSRTLADSLALEPPAGREEPVAGAAKPAEARPPSTPAKPNRPLPGLQPAYKERAITFGGGAGGGNLATKIARNKEPPVPLQELESRTSLEAKLSKELSEADQKKEPAGQPEQVALDKLARADEKEKSVTAAVTDSESLVDEDSKLSDARWGPPRNPDSLVGSLPGKDQPPGTVNGWALSLDADKKKGLKELRDLAKGDEKNLKAAVESHFLNVQDNFSEEIDDAPVITLFYGTQATPSPPPAAEAPLRAFLYYRSLDPTLTPEAFSARKLTVPPPAVGDEGLGQEGFKKRYGVSPFVDTRLDHLSTFGMDVDTASYTLARKMLEEGKLPDPKTVRVEEFVNYFQEEYPPDPSSVFSVFCEGGPSPFGGGAASAVTDDSRGEREPGQLGGLDLLKITVKARELRPGERKDAVLTFAVDTSGSMNLEDRLDLVRQALTTLIDSLNPDDRVGIVGFGAHAYLVLPHTPARERERILGAIHSLSPGGGTNVEAGLDLAYRVADEVFAPKAVNRIILCSDGVANVGARGPEEILKKVQVFSKRGIYLSCAGFGMGLKDALLETLADKGNGNYAYVDKSATAEKIFRDNLPATLQVLAQDAKIQVDFNPEVVSRYRLLGYEKRDIADEDFRNDKVDAGEVGPGTTVTVLYEIQRKTNCQGDLGRIYLRYLDTGTHRVDEVNYPLHPGVIATSLKDSSDRFRFVACAAEAAELLRSSYWARDGSFSKVLRVLSSLSPEYRARGDWKELAALVTRAQELTIHNLVGK